MLRLRLTLVGLVIVIPALAADPPPPAPAWTTDLAKMTVPDKPAAGKVLGGDFKVEDAKLDGGVLTLRMGKDFFPDASVQVFLFLPPDEGIEGKTYQVAAGDPAGKLPHVFVKRIPTGEKLPKGPSFVNGYAMKLEFGKEKEGKVPGKIYLCVPDEQKSFVAGTFTLEVKK